MRRTISKHTPGPWEAKNAGKHWNNQDIDNWIVTYGARDEQIVDHVYEEADARLVAAAPDLLEAACMVDAVFDLGQPIKPGEHGIKDPSFINEAFAKLRAAIEKAEKAVPSC